MLTNNTDFQHQRRKDSAYLPIGHFEVSEYFYIMILKFLQNFYKYCH